MNNESQEPKVINDLPKCPYCGTTLTFLMPDGKVLYCDKCKKYFENDNGKTGKETSSPYTKKDVLY